MGQTGYPDPASMWDQPLFKERFGRGYFWDTGNPPLSHDTPNMPWFQDPTEGMNQYHMGCRYLNDMIIPREDFKPGFSLKAMRPSTLGGYDFQQKDTEVYTLRLESKDVVNGGLFVLDVDWLPYGTGVWPAFWMVGSDPTDWLQHPPKTPGMGLRNYWPYRGEIDILEYVGAYSEEQKAKGYRNHVTLHTSAGCYSNRSTPSGRGSLKAGDNSGGSDCNHNNAFVGCSVDMGENTIGHPGFQGGIYACDWIKDSHVDCWFFDKNPNGTYAPDGSFEHPESNLIDPPPDPTKAYLTFKIHFQGGTEVNVPKKDHAFLIADVTTGEWISTLQMENASAPATREGRYRSVHPGWTQQPIPFGDYIFRVQEATATGGWSHTVAGSNLHEDPESTQVDANYSITISRGGLYVIEIPATYYGYNAQTLLGAAKITIPTEANGKLASNTTTDNTPKYKSNDGSQYVRMSPIDFNTATSVDVADLGPPDIRHDLSQKCHSRQGPPIDHVLSDMRFLLNTVMCGQWGSNIVGTSLPEDPEQMNYEPHYVEAVTKSGLPTCDQSVHEYIGKKKKRSGNRDYIHRRMDWDISFIKIYT